MTASRADRIALVDVDSCHCACQRAFHPELAGVPLVCLSNNHGCVVARSAEAKALGVEMGTPWFKIKTWAKHHATAGRPVGHLQSDEVYSIDEAFIRLRGTPVELTATGQEIRRRIAHDLDIPVSVGIAGTHTLAKLASHGAKHSPAPTASPPTAEAPTGSARSCSPAPSPPRTPRPDRCIR